MTARTRLKGSGWSNGERLTSDQATDIDIRSAYCVATDGDSEFRSACSIDIAGQNVEFVDNASGGSLTFDTIDLTLGANCNVNIGGSQYPTLSGAGGRTVTNIAPAYAVRFFTESDWTNGQYGWTCSNTSTASQIIFELGGLPIGFEITQVVVYVKGATSGTLPAVMPSVQVTSTSTTTPDSVDTNFGTTNDTSASNAAYIANHTISHTPSSSLVITAGKRYRIWVRQGIGGGAATGFEVQGFWINGKVFDLRTI